MRLRLATLCLITLLPLGLLQACKSGNPGNPGPTTASAGTGVAIIVVDDFGLGRDASSFGGVNDTCTVATNEVGSGGAGDGKLPAGWSHGDAVFNTLRRALASDSRLQPKSKQATLPTTTGPAPAEDWTYNSDTPVRLVGLHVDKYKTSDIISELTAMIDSMYNPATGPKFDRFVVNLSFVAFPCDVHNWISTDDLLAAYNDAVGSDDGLRQALGVLVQDGKVNAATLGANPTKFVVTQAAALIPITVAAFYQRVIANDQLNLTNQGVDQVVNDQSWQTFIQTYHIDGPVSRDQSRPFTPRPVVVPVGAAGNGVWDGRTKYRMPFPFAPALWNSVVSVSADGDSLPATATDTSRDALGQQLNRVADYANSGEVKLDGGNVPDAPDAYGTSFAAPRISALEARYLMAANPICNVPPLKYVTLPDALSKAGPLQTWLNLPSDQWPDPCGGFPRS